MANKIFGVLLIVGMVSAFMIFLTYLAAVFNLSIDWGFVVLVFLIARAWWKDG